MNERGGGLCWLENQPCNSTHNASTHKNMLTMTDANSSAFLAAPRAKTAFFQACQAVPLPVGSLSLPLKPS